MCDGRSSKHRLYGLLGKGSSVFTVRFGVKGRGLGLRIKVIKVLTDKPSLTIMFIIRVVISDICYHDDTYMIITWWLIPKDRLDMYD